MSAHRTLKFGFVGLLLLAAGLIVSANLWKSNLKVKRVTIEGNRIVETAEITQLIKVPKNSQLQDVDLAAVRRDILSHHFIKDAVIERDLPATLKVTVKERVPLAIINSAEILYLDEDGVVLPHSMSKQLFDLPVLTGMPDGLVLTPGTIIKHPDIQEALQILATSKLVNKELSHLLSEVRLRNGGDIVLYAAEWGVPIIFGRGEIANKLIRLESFWNSIVRERGSDNLQYVDLRFDDQVVVRWNKKNI
ncbi:MAG: FtsQ-type POTRA domain-containing protein [Ignavibacteriales bacterium]|nr:FtsQ-type POTRA domain-containing protein [Ignavibacteriales bacterium]